MKNRNKLITFAILTATATGIVHVMNKVIAASACLKEMLDTGNRHYYHWRFGDMNLVGCICEELSVLNFGQVLAQGETAKVLKDPAVITAYLGE